MSKTIRVRPVEGQGLLPLEAAPKRRLDREMEVPDTRYYRHALAKGSIELASAPTKPARSAKAEG